MYKPSIYNTLIPLTRERTLAYNGLTSSLAVWDGTEREIYDLLSRSGADNGQALPIAGNDRHLTTILENLEQGRFIVDEYFDERKLVDQLVNLARYDQSWATITIAPTLACNFGCDYCYQNDAARLGPMSGETRHAAMAFVKKRAEGRRGLSVAWYGGEPLLAKDLVLSMSEELAVWCEARRLAHSSIIVTNGYFLTGETAKRLAAVKISTAQVTLDGDKPSHDQRRILKGGGATFDRILTNIVEAAQVEGFSISLRVNIDKRNRNDIDGLLVRLQEAGLSGKENFRVYFAPVNVCSRECLRVADEVMVMDEYAELEAGLIERAIEMKLASAALPIRLFSLCAAVRPNGFVVLSNGDVHKCWNTVSYPAMRLCGLEDAGSIEESPLYKDWTTAPMFSTAQCGGCRALPNCTGGCAHMSRDGLSEAGNSCISLRHNIKERLVLYAISKEAITREDLRGEDLRREEAMPAAHE
jgi:uncharacterized protein